MFDSDLPASSIKERRRATIVHAAAELMDSRGGTDFSVEELADRAGVSRRTVFNYFASLDEVIVAVCAHVLSGMIEQLERSADAAPGDDASGSVSEQLIRAVRTTDLVAPMAYLTRTLGGDDLSETQRGHLLTRAVSDVGTALVRILHRRHPEADLLDLQLLVSAFTGGVLVVHSHWWQRTGAADTPQSRAVWADLLEHLITQLGSGFASDH